MTALTLRPLRRTTSLRNGLPSPRRKQPIYWGSASGSSTLICDPTCQSFSSVGAGFTRCRPWKSGSLSSLDRQGSGLMSKRQVSTGIYERHSRQCGSAEGGRCTCKVSYEARVYDKARDRQVTKTFQNKSEARAWRLEVQVELRQRVVTTANETVADLIADISDHFERGVAPSSNVRVLRPSTLRSCQGYWGREVLPALGKVKVRDLRKGDIEALLQTLRNRDLAPSSIANVFQSVRIVIRVAMDRDIITQDPSAGIKVSRKVRSPRKAMAWRDAQARVDALDGWLKVLYGVLAYSGLRIGEALALRWGDIDFENSFIHVQRSWDHKNGVFQDPKTAAGNRRIPLINDLRALLEEHLVSEGSPSADRLVFGGRDLQGTPRDYANMRYQARRKWEAAGLSYRSPHEFRHTFVTYLNRATTDQRAAADIAGHADIAFMLGRYVHSDGGSRSDAMTLFAEKIAEEDEG